MIFCVYYQSYCFLLIHLSLSHRLLWVRRNDKEGSNGIWDTNMQGCITEPEFFSAVPKPSSICFPVSIEIFTSVFASQEHL